MRTQRKDDKEKGRAIMERITRKRDKVREKERDQ